jgi:hypothetical protein
MEKMSAAENVYDAIRASNGADNLAQWAEGNPGAWRIVVLVDDLERKQ